MSVVIIPVSAWMLMSPPAPLFADVSIVDFDMSISLPDREMFPLSPSGLLAILVFNVASSIAKF